MGAHVGGKLWAAATVNAGDASPAMSVKGMTQVTGLVVCGATGGTFVIQFGDGTNWYDASGDITVAGNATAGITIACGASQARFRAKTAVSANLTYASMWGNG